MSIYRVEYVTPKGRQSIHVEAASADEAVSCAAAMGIRGGGMRAGDVRAFKLSPAEESILRQKLESDEVS